MVEAIITPMRGPEYKLVARSFEELFRQLAEKGEVIQRLAARHIAPKDMRQGRYSR
ncbi:MAG: hypothetical protein SOY30_16165 [Eubacteriales bacterium]|nr:hypothetical protein [Eubacteriales bacterium]